MFNLNNANILDVLIELEFYMLINMKKIFFNELALARLGNAISKN